LKSLNFAFIGCGKIAPFYADVIKHLGHTIDVVVARENSANIDPFSRKYGVRNQYYDMNTFLTYFHKSTDPIDAILVCTPWDMNEHAIQQLLPLEVPIMAEKPAVLSMEALNNLNKNYETKNLFPAYNRRFYDFVTYLKEKIEKNPLVCVDILSAEPFEIIRRNEGEKIAEYMLYFYTSHIIDLIFYLFGDIAVKDVISISKNRENSWVCELIAEKCECPIQMKILMDCPQNSYLTFFFEKEVVEMRPLERLVVYDKLERRKIDGQVTYLPAIKRKFETDHVFKPGFLKEMEYFIDNFVYRKNISLKHIDQLEQVTAFCDKLKRRKVYG
jgi:hypothetical protein